MNWLQQAVHVAKKDLRMSRWFLAVYLLVLAVSIPAALGDGYGWRMLLPILLTLIGSAFVAYVVQEDSPYRAEAFWASKPMQPTAVWGGKVLFILGVLVVPAVLAKAIVILAGFELAPSGFLDVTSASVWEYASALTAAAFVAALTPDLRTFFLTCVANFIAFMTLAAVAAASGMMATNRGGLSVSVMAAIGTIGILFLVAHIYQTRSRKLAIAVAVVYILVTLLSAQGPTRVAAEENDRSDWPAGLTQPTLAVSTERRVSVDEPGNLYLIPKLSLTEDKYAYTFTSISAELHQSNGKETELRSPTDASFINFPIPPAIDGAAWLGYDQKSKFQSNFLLPLSVKQKEAVLNRTATAIVHGDVNVLAPEIRFRIPAREGVETISGGLRFRIDETEATEDRVAITVSLSHVNEPGVGIRDDWGREPPQYGLVNRRLGTAIVLRRGGGSYGVFGLVVQGGNAGVAKFELENQTPGFGPGGVVPPRGFLDGAELVRFEWRPIVTMSVSAPVTVTPQPGWRANQRL